MFFPINISGIHWVLITVNIQEKRINYLDSLVTSANTDAYCVDFTDRIRNYLKQEWEKNKIKEPWVDKDWITKFPKEVTPQQKNGSDCGVYVCMFMDYYLEGKKLSFTEDNIAEARVKMLYYILQSCYAIK